MVSPGRVTGLAAVFDSPTVINEGGDSFDELIAPGAFASVLKRERRTIFAVNHDPSRLLGRVSSGTLKLAETAVGLHITATLPDTSLGHEIAELVARGDLTGASFSFQVRTDSWHKSPGSTRPLRVIRDLESLFDVSAVVFPAYGATHLTVERSSPAAAPRAAGDARPTGQGMSRDERMKRHRQLQAAAMAAEVSAVLAGQGMSRDERRRIYKQAQAPRIFDYGPVINPGIRLRNVAKRVIHP